MPDPKLANWRSRQEMEAERAAAEQSRRQRLDDVGAGRADPATLEEVVARLKALEARLSGA